MNIVVSPHDLSLTRILTSLKIPKFKPLKFPILFMETARDLDLLLEGI